MSRCIRLMLIVCLLVVPVIAVAMPPASYDSADWKRFIEDGKTDKLPKGIPNGVAAVSTYNGKAFWPTNFLDITKPYDLSVTNGLQFSKVAIEHKHYYGSETMKVFLEATVNEARRISGDKDFIVPVKWASFDQGIIPMRQRNAPFSSIEMGAFVQRENGADIELAGTVYHDYVRDQNTDLELNDYIEYTEYQKFVREEKPDLIDMGIIEYTQFMKKFYEAKKSNKRQTLKDSEGSGKEKIENGRGGHQKKESKEVRELREKIAELRVEIQNESEPEIKHELIEEMHQLTDELKELRGQNKVDAESAGFIAYDVDREIQANNQKHAEIVARNKNSAEHDGIKGVMRNEKLTRLQQVPMKLSIKYRPMAKDEMIDIPSMWTLIEAMLTQDAAYVSEIRMTAGLKVRLLKYARDNDKPEALVNLLKTRLSLVNFGFGVSLGCSARDRFLGCQLGSDDVTEKKITNASDAILRHVANASFDRKFELIRLVVNANPVKITTDFDVAVLKKELNEKNDISKNVRIKYQGLLFSLSKIEGVKDTFKDKSADEKNSVVKKSKAEPDKKTTAKVKKNSKNKPQKGKRRNGSFIKIPY